MTYIHTLHFELSDCEVQQNSESVLLLTKFCFPQMLCYHKAGAALDQLLQVSLMGYSLGQTTASSSNSAADLYVSLHALHRYF